MDFHQVIYPICSAFVPAPTLCVLVRISYFKSRDLSLSGPHSVSGQPSSIHVHRTRIAIRVPFQTNLGSMSSKCSQFYSSSIQLYRARLKRRARRSQSALIDLSYFYRARSATYSIEHGLPRIL